MANYELKDQIRVNYDVTKLVNWNPEAGKVLHGQVLFEGIGVMSILNVCIDFCFLSCLRFWRLFISLLVWCHDVCCLWDQSWTIWIHIPSGAGLCFSEEKMVLMWGFIFGIPSDYLLQINAFLTKLLHFLPNPVMASSHPSVWPLLSQNSHQPWSLKPTTFVFQDMWNHPTAYFQTDACAVSQSSKTHNPPTSVHVRSQVPMTG